MQTACNMQGMGARGGWRKGKERTIEERSVRNEQRNLTTTKIIKRKIKRIRRKQLQNEGRKGRRKKAKKQNRTAQDKCIHLYDETQGTIKHNRFRQRVFVECKKTDIYLLTPDEDSLSKALVFNCSLCFVIYVGTFLWSCSILSTSPAVVHSFQRNKEGRKERKNRKQTRELKETKSLLANGSESLEEVKNTNYEMATLNKLLELENQLKRFWQGLSKHQTLLLDL